MLPALTGKQKSESFGICGPYGNVHEFPEKEHGQKADISGSSGQTMTTTALQTTRETSSSPESWMAEEEGFEPPVPLGTAVFKTAALSRSATPPGCQSSGPRRSGRPLISYRRSAFSAFVRRRR